jgi:hypothetical protein
MVFLRSIFNIRSAAEASWSISASTVNERGFNCCGRTAGEVVNEGGRVRQICWAERMASGDCSGPSAGLGRMEAEKSCGSG